jgi:hypothetical protein
MIKTIFPGLLILASMGSYAAPSNEMVYMLKASIAKIHSVNTTGGKSTGTGVVVAENKVATNCHVLANSVGMDIGAMGEHYQPVGIQADWKHDICILNFQFLPLKAAPLGDSEHLQYEQEIFSIGFPGGPPKPLTTFGSIKALYPMDESVVIRTSASFQMGASGSPLFNMQGEVIGLNTFKSPGHNAFFYNVPAQWVKSAMLLPVKEFGDHYQPAFWEENLDHKPYWMQVVLPAQNNQWGEVESIVKRWIVSRPYDTEAQFYDALSKDHLGHREEAKKIYQRILKQSPLHSGSLINLAAIAKSEGQVAELGRYQDQLAKLNIDLSEIDTLSVNNGQ